MHTYVFRIDADEIKMENVEKLLAEYGHREGLVIYTSEESGEKDMAYGEFLSPLNRHAIKALIALDVDIGTVSQMKNGKSNGKQKKK